MIHDLIEEINDTVRAAVSENLVRVPASRIGLDYRAGIVYVGDDCVAVSSSSRGSLDYYGGFEYVNDDDKQVVGDFTFYFDSSDRVAEALEAFEEETV